MIAEMFALLHVERSLAVVSVVAVACSQRLLRRAITNMVTPTTAIPRQRRKPITTLSVDVLTSAINDMQIMEAEELNFYSLVSNNFWNL